MTATDPIPPPSTPTRRRARRLGRSLALAAAAAATLLGGVWVTGGVVTNDAHAAMGLTTAWIVITGAAALAVARARRPIGLPIAIGHLAAATAIGAYLGYAMLHERVVREAVATGTPASVKPPAAAGEGREPPRTNVEEAAGTFRSGEHSTRGTARVVRLRNGARVLTLTGFATSPGPDLRVRIVPGAGTDGSAGGAIDLGALKGNRGDQQYELPAGLRPRRHTVLIWCRAFSALFGSARLAAS